MERPEQSRKGLKRNADEVVRVKRIKLSKKKVALNIEDLSEDVLIAIFRYLDATAIYNMLMVSKRFRNLFEIDRYWSKIDARRKPITFEMLKYCLERINPQTTELFLGGSKRMDNIFTIPAAINLKNSANLRVLALENQTIDGEKVTLNDFPNTLEELSLKRTFILSNIKFFKQTCCTMGNLRVLVLDHCKSITAEHLLSISKYSKLEILSLYNCRNLTDEISYISIAGRFGFNNLRILNLRFVGVGDQVLKTLYRHPKLQEIYFQDYDRTYKRSCNRRKMDILNGAVKEEISYMSDDDADFEDILGKYPKKMESIALSGNGVAMYRYVKPMDERENYVINSVLYKDQYPECTCGFFARHFEICANLNKPNQAPFFILDVDDQLFLNSYYQQLSFTSLMDPISKHMDDFFDIYDVDDVIKESNAENKSTLWLYVRKPLNDYEISIYENVPSSILQTMEICANRNEEIVLMKKRLENLGCEIVEDEEALTCEAVASDSENGDVSGTENLPGGGNNNDNTPSVDGNSDSDEGRGSLPSKRNSPRTIPNEFNESSSTDSNDGDDFKPPGDDDDNDDDDFRRRPALRTLLQSREASTSKGNKSAGGIKEYLKAKKSAMDAKKFKSNTRSSKLPDHTTKSRHPITKTLDRTTKSHDRSMKSPKGSSKSLKRTPKSHGDSLKFLMKRKKNSGILSFVELRSGFGDPVNFFRRIGIDYSHFKQRHLRASDAAVAGPSQENRSSESNPSASLTERTDSSSSRGDDGYKSNPPPREPKTNDDALTGLEMPFVVIDNVLPEPSESNNPTDAPSTSGGVTTPPLSPRGIGLDLTRPRQVSPQRPSFATGDFVSATRNYRYRIAGNYHRSFYNLNNRPQLPAIRHPIIMNNPLIYCPAQGRNAYPERNREIIIQLQHNRDDADDDDNDPLLFVIGDNNEVYSNKISMKKMSFRGSKLFNDPCLHHLRELKLELLDVCYTNVTAEGLKNFMMLNPQCRVIHERACVCKPRMHF